MCRHHIGTQPFGKIQNPQALLDELKRRYPRCEAQDASFREYGFGATLVKLHK